MEVKKFFDCEINEIDEDNLNKMPVVYAYANYLKESRLVDVIRNLEEKTKNDDVLIKKIYLQMAVNMSATEYVDFTECLNKQWDLLEDFGGSYCSPGAEEELRHITDEKKYDEFVSEHFKAFGVGIYRDGRLKLIVNPEGYNYARYTMIPTADSLNLPF